MWQHRSAVMSGAWNMPAGRAATLTIIPVNGAGLIGPAALEGAPQLGREDGVAAVVLKPSALGSFERSMQLSAWARHRCWPFWPRAAQT